MLGLRSGPRGPFEADHMYPRHLGRHSFYGFPALMRGQLLRDERLSKLMLSGQRAQQRTAQPAGCRAVVADTTEQATKKTGGGLTSISAGR